MMEERGATQKDWYWFDFVLGLGAHLLPCVPAAPDVKVVAGSALQGKVGKIPSAFNSSGEAHGLLEWQKRPILSNEVALWSKDPRLNICVRTGPISNVYAFDIDIDDENQAAQAFGLLGGMWPGVRCRPNSFKMLVPFLMEEPCKKRKIKLDNTPKGPAIELLADGQQFVAAGSHSSGVRYQWVPGLPDLLPTLTLAQLNQIWEKLTRTYAPKSASPTSTSPTSSSTSDTTSPPSNSSHEKLTEISDIDWQQLLDALRFLSPHAGDEQLWAEIGISLLSIKDCGKPVKQLWLDFSRKAPNWQEGAAEQWWEAHTRE